jgi:selenocysteine lyase/cysteine desulfurase
LESTARASFALYTTREEIDFLADTLARVREFFT